MKANVCKHVLGVTLSLLLIIATCSFAASGPQVTELKFVSFKPNQWPGNAGFGMFIEKVKQKTNGQLVIRFVGGPEAMAPVDASKAVQSGAIPVANVMNSLADQVVSGFRVLTHNELPFRELRERALPYIQEICNKAGIYYLGQSDSALPQTMLYNFSTKKITKLDDFKGVKMGTPSPLAIPFYRALGAVPQVVPLHEYYTGIERGVIEGTITAMDLAVQLGLHQVVKTVIDQPYTSSPAAFIMNLKTWNSLPKDFQNALTEAAFETESDFSEMFDAKITEPARQTMKKAGVQFVKFSPAEAAKYYDLYKTASWAEEAKRNPEVVNTLKALITK